MPWTIPILLRASLPVYKCYRSQPIEGRDEGPVSLTNCSLQLQAHDVTLNGGIEIPPESGAPRAHFGLSVSESLGPAVAAAQ